MLNNNCKESVDKILQEAPTARKALLENYSNLHKVENTRSVTEESKALTTQALASVTYQINNLATSVLKLLDAQALQLKHMETSVNMLSLTVDMYKEKIARKEIGVLTTQSKVPRTQKIVPPATGLEAIRMYRRVPISYTRLDKLGHGNWQGNKTSLESKEEPIETDNRESFQPISTQETSSFSWSFLGIAVPPPSVPDWAAPPDPSPTSPSPSVPSHCSPSPPPYAYPDLSMLPPPPPPDDEMEDAPPPPPSPPQSNMPLFPSGQNTYMTSADPPPPPPPPPTKSNTDIPPPPPPPFSSSAYSGSSGPPQPPPPPPPNTGGKFVPPPPPPPF